MRTAILLGLLPILLTSMPAQADVLLGFSDSGAEIVFHHDLGDGPDLPGQGVGNAINEHLLCLPIDGSTCYTCLVLEGPTDVYLNPLTSEGLGVGVEVSSTGATAKVGRGQLDCP